MSHSINRFELKYVVDAFKAKAFLAGLAPFVNADPRAGADGFYRVTSLYYDSPDRRFYREKVEGLRNRRKLRIRIYPAPSFPAGSEAWVEIKERFDRTVRKRRISMGLPEAENLCAGRLDPSSIEAGDREAASEVLSLVESLRLEPACVVSYVRRAFVGTVYDQGLRVTFDTCLTARAHALELGRDVPGRMLIHPGLCVVEVKVDNRAPGWLAELVAAHDLTLRRMSKYCLGIEKTALRAGSVFC